MRFEVLDVDALARIGKIEFGNKTLITPTLFPVVHPYNNTINPSEIKEIGFKSIFTNAYILYQNKEKRKVVLKKGIHQFLGYDGLIATDSGAFQQYMYNAHGIEIKAAEIEHFQEGIKSDFPVILDYPVQPEDDFSTAEKKVDVSLTRAKENIERRKNKASWIGPVHGATHFDLLKKSAKKMSKLEFDIFAIGGLVKYFLNYQFDKILRILLTVKKEIISNKPLHLFGLGLPQFFSLAIAFGCDLMDSAAYALYAKEDRYFTLSTGTRDLKELKEFPCTCPICSTYTPNELKSFPKPKKINLLAKHNLYVSHSELQTIRQSIRNGNLWELVEQRVRSHPRLLDALAILKEHNSFFECYEKVYKPHGRLFSSIDSKYRPILYRYRRRIQNRYSIPKESKFALFLPELDIKGRNSPTIANWLDKINNSKIISRKSISVLFYSKFFGIIPLGLMDTFPTGQYESSLFKEASELLYNDIPQRIMNFLNKKPSNYEKCAFLIPKTFTNQYDEEVQFYEEPVIKMFQIIKSNLTIPLIKADNIKDILLWF